MSALARDSACAAVLLAAAWMSGCAATEPAPPAAATAGVPAAAAPAGVAIHEWTHPVSMKGDGRPDALEAVVEVRDAVGEPTLAQGAFHFELEARRRSDRMGPRVGFWPVTLNDPGAASVTHRDGLTRLYHVPLRLDGPPLPAGRYVITLWLQRPDGPRMYARREFEYDGGPAPPPSVL